MGLNKGQTNSGSFKKGEHRSSKTEFKKGEHKSKTTEFKKGSKPWNTGKKWSNNIIEKLRKSHIGLLLGDKNPMYKPKIEKECLNCNEHFFVNPARKDTALFCSGSCKSKFISKKLWADPNYRDKVIKATLKGLMKRPSSFERKILDLCAKYHLPFIYTGDGRVLIGHKNPDFIDEKNKIIIEVFLNYFKIKNNGSIENYVKERAEHFSKFGYKTIFIREEEINAKNWEEICLNKLK